MQKNIFFLALITLLIFTSCDKDDNPIVSNPPTNNAKNIIMPLGASRVEGARPDFESYRYELWKLLVDSGKEFDFIGSGKDESSYPTYSGKNFDVDHEGHGGYTSGQILSNLEDWLSQTGTPDMVLLSSPGGNDALENLSYDNAVNNINTIVDILQTANPNIVIIIEQMAPARSDLMTNQLSEFMQNMNQEVISIAAAKTTSTSTIMTVDMFTDFTDTYLADDVHYSESGATFIANRYYNTISSLLE